MEFIGIDDEKASLSITPPELDSIIKILQFTLVELEHEYFTRTGFYESETEALVTKLENAPDRNNIGITNQELLNLRQNLVEVLFAISNIDFESQYKLSRDAVNTLFEEIDRYGKQHGAWN